MLEQETGVPAPAARCSACFATTRPNQLGKLFPEKKRSLTAARMLEQETGVEPARISLGS